MIDFLIKVGLGAVGFISTALLAFATIGIWCYGLIHFIGGFAQ